MATNSAPPTPAAMQPLTDDRGLTTVPWYTWFQKLKSFLPSFPLSVSDGGTGDTTLTAHGVLVGEGTLAVAAIAPDGTVGIPIISQGTTADPIYGVAVVQGGGTGLATLAVHAVLLGEGVANVGTVVPNATSGLPLISQGTAADPVYGVAVVQGGGTGTNSLPAHAMLIGNGTSAVANLAPGASGHLAVSNGTDWTSALFPAPTPWQMPLVSAKTGLSVAIPATPAAGTFGIASGLLTGDHEYLYTETANNSTVTDVVIFEFNYPVGFPSTGTFNVTVNCAYVLGAGTIGTHTIAMELYEFANNGTITALGGLTTNVPSSAGDLAFAITAVNPGLALKLATTMVIQETAGQPVTAQINGVRIST